MEEQQRTQQLFFEKNGNGKHSQPSLPIYAVPFQENTQTDDEWDLRQLLTVVRRRALVISVAIALSATVCVLTLTRQPKYEGKFQLLVEPVTKESKLEDLTQIPGINTNLQKEGLDYESQIKVLQSPELMAPIIKNLFSQYPDINYDSLLEFEDLKITRLAETKILEISYQDPDPQKIQFVLQQLAKDYLKYSLQERQTNLRQGI